MKQTTNLKLNKPDTGDTVDVSVLNENMDTLDGVVSGKADKSSVRKITTSTADPSGGADGDIWFKYE